MEHKAQEILPEDIWNEEKSKAVMQFILEKRQKELDEFAIGFADWFHANCYENQVGYYTASELLETYKKEKGL